MTSRVIIDTGPLVAIFNRRDGFHAWTTSLLGTLTAPLWTCEAVLTEAAHLTRQPHRLLQMVSQGVLRVGIDVATEAASLSRLIEKYRDRMDLADACVVRMSELFKQSRVFTLDKGDFTVYRRNGRDVIPLLAPDGS